MRERNYITGSCHCAVSFQQSFGGLMQGFSAVAERKDRAVRQWPSLLFSLVTEIAIYPENLIDKAAP
jgi:hypothetical protein